MRVKKTELFFEGLPRALECGIDVSTFALEFDFSDDELLYLAKQDGMICPQCRTNKFLDCIDGHIICTRCGWEYR